MTHRLEGRDEFGDYYLISRGHTSESSSIGDSEWFEAMMILPAILAALVLDILGPLKLTFVISATLCALVGAGIALQIHFQTALGALVILAPVATVVTVVALTFAISALYLYLSNRSKAKDSASTDQTVAAAAVAPSQATTVHVASKSDPAADAGQALEQTESDTRQELLDAESAAIKSITEQEKLEFSDIFHRCYP